jgi:hypothetical protein
MFLLEQPLLILLGGLLIVSILIAVGLQTGSSRLLVAGIAVAAVTAGLLVVERAIETEREQVERTLREIAASVQRGNLDELLSYAHSSAIDVRRQAESEFHHFQIEEVRITQFWETEVETEPAPERAVASFNVSVKGGQVAGEGIGVGRVWRHVIVTLEKEQGQWKVVSYEHNEPHPQRRRISDR